MQLSITIQPDEFTNAAAKAFDYNFNGISYFDSWAKPLVPENYNIGLIIGPSGSGKTILLKEFGVEKVITWDNNKAIISHFLEPNEAINKLIAVGLNTIPAWCKPFHVLSNGEQFRANLARKLENNAVIDEFTSVVDRNVAKSTSVATHRYIHNNNLKNIVFASCHYDILEWLCPDWYFDTSDGVLHDGRCLRRPTIELKIYPCKRNIWTMFAKHHYLSTTLNPTCRSYISTASFNNELEIIVGFVSSLSLPSGTVKNAYREHRTVVLPDYQGLGIGPRISDAVAQIHINEGKRYFSRTAHPRFGEYRNNSPLWKATSKNRKKRDDIARRVKNGYNFNNYNFDDVRVCYSHEYIGK